MRFHRSSLEKYALRRGNTSSQRQIRYSTFPFPFEAAGRYQNDVVDHARDRNAPPSLKKPRHPVSQPHAVEGVPGHRADIVRQHGNGVFRGPQQHFRITQSRQADVLNAQNDKVPITSPHASDDVVVEIFIGEKREHGLTERRFGAP